MPALANIRHERFCRMWIKTGVAARAYAKAGYETTTERATRAAASRLLAHVNVKRRIAELKKQMATRNRITVDTLLSDLAEDRALARELGQPSAAISATALAAKLTGLLVDRKESGAPGDFSGLQTEAEVLALVKAELGDESAQALAQALAKADAEPVLDLNDVDEVDPPYIEPSHDGSGTPN